VKSCSQSKDLFRLLQSPILREPGDRSRYSNWLQAGGLRGQSSSPSRVNNFLFSTSSRLALGLTQPPIQWVAAALSPGVSGCGVKLTTHLQLVPRSRKCGSIHPLPRTSSWHSAYLVKHSDNFTSPQFSVLIISRINLWNVHVNEHTFFWNNTGDWQYEIPNLVPKRSSTMPFRKSQIYCQAFLVSNFLVPLSIWEITMVHILVNDIYGFNQPFLISLWPTV
jgi:hypothetical protein